MNRTLWSSGSWLLYEGELKYGESMICEVTQRDLDCLNRAKGGDASLITYDCRQGPSLELQVTVDTHLSPRLDEDSQCVAPLATRASFARVLYLAHESQPHSMAHLTTFELPVEYEVAGDSEEPAYEAGWVSFSLVAMVRMRKEHDSPDYVRTFEPSGSPMHFTDPPESYMDNYWSVTDPGAQRYMLVYAEVSRKPKETRETLHVHACSTMAGSERIRAIPKTLEHISGPHGVQSSGETLRPPMRSKASSLTRESDLADITGYHQSITTVV
ncbi:hypothetical protein NM208_g13216 [Fusarium decemcellulare]|uniref:Uncharacterized protein n=1 Tax=Fusarium decemcellulare TaxID=57161 RepID=A0ACC1RKM6_9HYPO|nr:hypothetical protein NM208_g13216 [Fusarium decemcellulare]